MRNPQIKINITNPANWHRMPNLHVGRCPLCGCPAQVLSSRAQQHKRIDQGGAIRYETRPSTCRKKPEEAIAARVRRAAKAAAVGLTLFQSAKAAEISAKKLQSYRRHYPEYWNASFANARKRFLAGELRQWNIAADEEDRGLTAKTRHGIRVAIGMLVTGLTYRQVAKNMKITPRKIHDWLTGFPGYSRRCREQALAVAKSVIKAVSAADAAPPDPAAFLRQVRKAEEWTKRYLPDDPAADPLRNIALSPKMRLTEFYWSYYRPICLESKGRRPATTYEYETSLKYWRDFTSDPPIGKITPYVCAAFVKALLRLRGQHGEAISPTTVRKHCKQLQYILDRLAPRNRDNRQGTGLLPDVPFLDSPRARPKPPIDSFRVEEIQRWIEIADNARLPKIAGIRPGEWWRCLILFCFNSGLRIGTVLELKWSMLSGNQLDVPAEIYKGGCPHRFYLSEHALEAIEPLENLPGNPEKIFASPYTNHRPLHAIRRRMFENAGIPENRRFGFHGLRKAAATEIARINPEGARLMMGHASLKTTIGHYIHPALQAEVMNALPQPMRRAEV